MQPGDIIGTPDDGKDRGLHFICFNTQIGRQFWFLAGAINGIAAVPPRDRS